MILKLLSIATVVAITVSGTGCASASAKLDSKRDYRQAQVQAIKVQREADVIAQQHLSAERVAMWNALSEAVCCPITTRRQLKTFSPNMATASRA